MFFKTTGARSVQFRSQEKLHSEIRERWCKSSCWCSQAALWLQVLVPGAVALLGPPPSWIALWCSALLHTSQGVSPRETLVRSSACQASARSTFWASITRLSHKGKKKKSETLFYYPEYILISWELLLVFASDKSLLFLLFYSSFLNSSVILPADLVPHRNPGWRSRSFPQLHLDIFNCHQLSAGLLISLSDQLCLIVWRQRTPDKVRYTAQILAKGEWSQIKFFSPKMKVSRSCACPDVEAHCLTCFSKRSFRAVGGAHKKPGESFASGCLSGIWGSGALLFQVWCTSGAIPL